MRSSEVRRVFQEGRPFHAARMVLLLAPGTGRFAVVAARRVGGAVERNRARRILRAAWRQVAQAPTSSAAEQGSLVVSVRGYDAVLVAKEVIGGATTQELVTEMRELLRQGAKDR